MGRSPASVPSSNLGVMNCINRRSIVYLPSRCRGAEEWCRLVHDWELRRRGVAGLQAGNAALGGLKKAMGLISGAQIAWCELRFHDERLFR
ncbi:hypothetical protein E2C01_067452 [Portunus trituberculatus]|uniref:Uncharacterized protein n=1 Tax=Portunus trituberculatus TaxID=210409 RepID=A0A5B7HTN1_PORTR|nr:hypothetical protein [Portunus trituberculatus]